MGSIASDNICIILSYHISKNQTYQGGIYVLISYHSNGVCGVEEYILISYNLPLFD